MIAGFLLYILTVFTVTPPTTNNVVLHFNHFANGQKLEVVKMYRANTDSFSVTKLRYYISHVVFFNKKKEATVIPGIFLIDAFGADSITLNVPAGKYSSVSFMVGLDSAIHVSGAQDGALDPLNDMYWAWNTGYVNFKLEGHSSQAKTDLHRLQYHIGGFRSGQKTMQQISLPIKKPLHVTDKISASLHVKVDLDKFWNEVVSPHKLPVVMKPGADAMLAASRLSNIFISAN